jgi:hypothetical protein
MLPPQFRVHGLPVNLAGFSIEIDKEFLQGFIKVPYGFVFADPFIALEAFNGWWLRNQQSHMPAVFFRYRQVPRTEEGGANGKQGIQWSA